MRGMTKVVALAITAVLVLGACEAMQEEKTHRQKDQETQDQTISRLQQEIPAPRVNYAPTRRAVVEWIRRWDAPDKVAFVYLMADNGQTIGYYVSRGLPVSYCVGLTPPDQVIGVDVPGDGQVNDRPFQVAAPALDGVYYSGGDCNHYYLFDAGTDAYIEFGGGIRFFVSDQALPVQAEPLGITTIEDTEAPGFQVAEEGTGE